MDFKAEPLTKMREHAIRIFHKGLQAVEAGAAVRRHCKIEGPNLVVGEYICDLRQYERVFVIGAGKASGAMALALEEMIGDRITAGIVNVKYRHTAPVRRIRLWEAGHPLPDENGEKGALAMLDLIRNTGEKDLVLCLLSGGGSALFPHPYQGLTLREKQETTQVLLNCGATIHEINAIRKHSSAIKGGRLAQLVHPATLVSLILSDVVGDDLDVIASGPSVPDSSTFQDCMDILDKYRIAEKVPTSLVSHIRAGLSGQVPETPKADDPVFETTHNQIVGSNTEAILAAKREAERLGYASLVLSSMIEGETRPVAQVHAAVTKEILKTGHPLPSPACILSGGETTVTIMGKGRGGRNQEFALAAAMEISGWENIVILSAGTDGTDGPTDAAGAIADTHTLKRAAEIGLSPRAFLEDNDAYHFFKALDDLLLTGPTNTNVMDLRIALVVARRK